MKKILILFILLSFFYSCKKEINYQLTETIKKDGDTLFLNDTALVFISPSIDELDKLKRKLGEDDFYIIADDMNFYRANAYKFLDSLKIKYSNRKNSEIIAYKKNNKLNIVSLSESEWYTLFYKDGKLIKIDLPMFIEDYQMYSNKSKNINKILEENQSTPSAIVDNLIFTKDNNGNLQINTEILDYISKTTTKENSSYLFALEGYEKKYRYSNRWSIDEFAKIRGYIFNTSYPLRKKYWSDKYEEWYNGEPEYIFGDSDSWRDNDYYGLPHLKEYVEDFIVKYW